MKCHSMADEELSTDTGNSDVQQRKGKIVIHHRERNSNNNKTIEIKLSVYKQTRVPVQHQRLASARRLLS